MRVPSFLNDQQVPFETITHPPAFTASRRAHLLNTPGKQLAKCVLLDCWQRLVLAILPATHDVDLNAVSAKLGGPVRLARREEIPEVFRDCEWGGLVPFGSLYGVQSLLDDAFDSEKLLAFEAHQHGVAVRMRCKDFERLEKPQRFAFGVRK